MNTTLTIEIEDWLEEAMHEEAGFDSRDALLEEHVRNKWTPLKSGRMAIAARQAGKAPEDILSANKLLLNTGAAVEIVQMFVRRYRQSKANGAYQVRTFVGSVRAADEEEPTGEGGGEGPQTYIASTDPEAAVRAEDYLMRIVPGHVWNRLMIMTEQGVDVKEVIERFVAKIEAMAERLEPVTE